MFIFDTNFDVFGQQLGRNLGFLGYFEFFSLGILLMGIKWEKRFDLRIFLGRLQLMEVVAFVGQFLPSGGGFVSIFPFLGFSMFPCCLPGASVGQFWDFRFPGTEQRMVATESHTPWWEKVKEREMKNI